MSMKLIALIAFCTASLSANKIESAEPPTITKEFVSTDLEATSWAKKYQNAEPAHLQLLANLLYCSYRHAALDEAVRNGLITHIKLVNSMRKLSNDYLDVEQVATELMQKTTPFLRICIYRYQAYKQWQHCIHCLEKQTSPLLSQAIDSIQKHGQLIVTDYFKNNTATFDSLALQASNIATEKQKKIDYSNRIIKTYLTQNLHSTSPAEAFLMRNDAIMQTLNVMENDTYILLEAIAPVAQYKNNILRKMATVFAIYYQALYPYLQKLEPSFQALMFDQNGLLEKRIELPKPNLLFSALESGP